MAFLTRASSIRAFVALMALCPAAFCAPAVADHICAASRRSGGPASSYGTVHLANSCTAAVQPALQGEFARLHSFEADPEDFVAIGQRDPHCALAWWGAAMSARGNPLGGSLDDKALRTGRRFVDHALAIRAVTPREQGLIGAMDIYYRPYKDQIARARAYADAMDALHAAVPDDPDIAAFDALAIIEGVDLDDKTFARQKRAGAILEQVMAAHPENPGAPHYLIHAYDYSALAARAVPAAEIYPTIATASSHAQHMPSHIWSMLGEWDKSIAANRAASFLVDPTSANAAIEGDIVFDHAFDFIAYARLQTAQDRHVAQDIAASPAPPLVVKARYVLERGDWAGAQRLALSGDVFDHVLARFTRAYGAARAGNAAQARQELAALRALKPTVQQSLGDYWAAYVDIYASAAEAWVLKDDGKPDAALALMTRAADRADGHGKHIYLENKILPMRESLGDMQLALQHPQAALAAYTQSLALSPNRYRSFLGAAQAAEASGDRAAAGDWWHKLLALTHDGDHDRPGFMQAKAFFAGNG